MNLFRGGKKVLIGAEHLKEEFANSKKAFIVCDPFLAQNDKTSYLTDKLDEINVGYEIYSDITPDPSIELVTKGILALVDAGADTIVGFGGGSAIDACKAMMYFARQQGMIEECKFIAIPTTSGTGSEVTDFSVITDTEKQVKYPLVDESLLPDVAVLDAELVRTVPKDVTAVTGMDVLTHSIEAYVSKNSNDFSDAMAEKAIKLVRNHLVNAYKNPDDMVARQGMHNASCMAGIAFNNAGLGLNHGMAHAFGARFHVPHGKANAILLPYVMGFNAGCFDNLTDNAQKYSNIARMLYMDSSSVRQSSLNLIRGVKKLNDDLGIPMDIKSLGIPAEEFKAALSEMAEAALKDKCTATSPRPCTKEDIEKIYTHAYFGHVGRKF